MNTQQRFLDTMLHGSPDHPPLFEEGIRDGVLEAWREQGLPTDVSLEDLFVYDRREEIDLETRPDLDIPALARKRDGLKALRRHLEKNAEERMPENWHARLPEWRGRSHALMLLVHWGFLQAIGIQDWRSFAASIYMLADQPDFVAEALMIQGEFAARLAERLLQEVQIDAAIFSEPIGGNHGALVSPHMYRQFALPGYRPILDVLHRYGVPTIIWRTYANTRVLLPAAVEAGVNCLWAVESNPQAMDYLSIRQEFGRDLRLIGGIDLDVLREGPEAIRGAMERVIPPLLAQGGYIPLADGRVRPDMPFKRYAYYRELLEQLTG
jgi:Uroporphyrinogen decarboxylase (URO-D)